MGIVYFSTVVTDVGAGSASTRASRYARGAAGVRPAGLGPPPACIRAGGGAGIAPWATPSAYFKYSTYICNEATITLALICTILIPSTLISASRSTTSPLSRMSSTTSAKLDPALELITCAISIILSLCCQTTRRTQESHGGVSTDLRPGQTW